jgi:ElaA protein
MSWRIEQTQDLTHVHALRRTVFIQEQGVPEHEEWDDLDGQAVHLLAWVADRPVGTARLLVEGQIGRIGRICVLTQARGTGLGAALVQEALDRLLADRNIRAIRLGAQIHATGFYEKLGFRVCGPEYDDAGIPHHEMELIP